MAFRIGFTGEPAPDGGRRGEITLGDRLETFSADTRHFAPDRYERQWRRALEMALVGREVAALFHSVSLDADGVGQLWLYPVIPSELAEIPEAARRQTASWQGDDGGVYLAERFLHVTTEPDNFRRRIYTEFEDGTRGEELALHFLDLDAPERVFGYLDGALAGISHWYLANAEIAAFLGNGPTPG